MNKEITNTHINKSGSVIYHGYQEWYWNDKLTLRCMMKKGRQINYEEYHGIKITKYTIR